jgi:hypothetical protein
MVSKTLHGFFPVRRPATHWSRFGKTVRREPNLLFPGIIAPGAAEADQTIHSVRVVAVLHAERIVFVL